MKRVVLLLSSGLDSAANLILDRDMGFEVQVALTINYGQRGAPREKAQAALLAKHFGIEHVNFDLSGFSKLVDSSSALLKSQDQIPTLAEKDLDHLKAATQTAKAVWVPNRNGVLLNLAAALAESRGLDGVAVGFNSEEAVTFPDNTEEFMAATTAAFGFSTSNQIKVFSATVRLNKKEIVQRLYPRQFPFHLLWSCYRSGEKHCGQCESCSRLKRAITQGVSDEADRNQILSQLFGAIL